MNKSNPPAGQSGKSGKGPKIKGDGINYEIDFSIPGSDFYQVNVYAGEKLIDSYPQKKVKPRKAKGKNE
jgi:hypothetical protein